MPPIKKLLRFSLRAFLVVLTLICLCLGLIIGPAARQRDAVAWVRAFGGVVVYESESDESVAAGPRLQWLSELIGRDYFDTVTEVAIVGKRLTDIRQLAGLPRLKQLNLAGNRIDDISPLRSLVGLQRLNIDANRIADISAVSRMKDLEVLLADANYISDIKPLFELPRLTNVSLRGNYVSAKDVERLRVAFPECSVAPQPPRKGLDGFRFNPDAFKSQRRRLAGHESGSIGVDE
jgi:hypothetical protein